MNEPPKHIIIIIHVAAWLLLFFISVSIQFRDYGFPNSILRSVVNLSMIGTLFYLHFYFIDQFFEKRKFIIYGVFISAATVLSTLCRIVFNERLMRLPLEEIVIDRTLSVWLFGISTAAVALVISFLYQMIKNRYEKEKQHLSIINEQNEARIQYLKAQINPHFLFNSLNNIYSLAVTKSDQTPEMVLRLSSLLRYAIYEGEKRKVALVKEVEQIREFIALFEMKSEDDLNVTFKIEGDINQVEIEPMLLIPLVENCFKHGGFENNPAAFAEINLNYSKQKLHFSTRNSKDKNIQKDKVGGVGLHNIRKRLEVNYGDDFRLETRETDDVFEVELELFFESNLRK